LISFRGQLDTANTEKDMMEANLRALNEVVKNLERHSMEYNNELTEAKDELVKLRGERERYEIRV
jgi:chromosome segregation ATPase